VQLVFPQQGVNRNFLRSDQNQFQQGYLAQFQASSCWNSTNIIPYDMQYGRLRGGSRPRVMPMLTLTTGSGNVQALVASAFDNPNTGNLIGDYFLYIDRLGVPEATFNADGTVNGIGYVPCLESNISLPTDGYFQDVSSGAIAPKGMQVASWATYVDSSANVAYPIALRDGLYLPDSTYASIADGLLFSAGGVGTANAIAANMQNQPTYLLSYTKAQVQVNGIFSINSLTAASLFQAQVYSGVTVGYPPTSGSASFANQCAFAAATATGGAAASLVVVSGIGPLGQSHTFTTTQTLDPSNSEYFIGSIGMRLNGTATATLVTTISGLLQTPTSTFAPVNSTTPGIYASSTTATYESFTLNFFPSAAGAATAAAAMVLNSISPIAGGTFQTTPNSSIVQIGSNSLMTNVSFDFFASGFTSGAATFANATGTRGYTQVSALGDITKLTNGTFTLAAVNIGSVPTNYPAPFCTQFSMGDGRIVRDIFPYGTNLVDTGLDQRSFSAWSSKSLAPSPGGPLSHFLSGTAAADVYNSPAMSLSSGFCQGVSCLTPGWNGALLSTLATKNVCGGTFAAAVTVGILPNTGTFGSSTGIVLAPSLAGNYSSFPAISIEYFADSGVQQCQQWTIGSAVSSTSLLQTATNTPYFSQISPSPVTVGVQVQGSTLTLINNGTSVGSQFQAPYDVGLALSNGNISIGIGTSIPASGPTITTYGLSILPLVQPTYAFGTGLNQYLLAIANGCVSIYVASGGKLTLVGPPSGVFFTTSGDVNTATIDEFVYATDGINPVAVIDVATNTVNALTPINGLTGAVGTAPIPTGCSIICEWRSRLCLAQGTNLFMSRINQPGDFDFSQEDPPAAVALPLLQQADLGGTIPSPITVLMAANNDVLIIGCSDSVWALVGDPGANGTIININRGSGVFGANAWTRDDLGNLYWCNNNGLFTYNGSSPPQNLSLNQYDQFFQAIDGTQNTVTLEYRAKTWAIFIFVQPNDGSQGTHIMFDIRNNGFWPVEMPPQVGPFAVAYVGGGGPAQREFVFGGTNSTLYTFDTTSTYTGATYLDLGTTAINAEIDLGPIHPGPPGQDSIVLTIDMTLGEPAAGDSTNAFGGSIVLQGGKSAYDVTEGTPRIVRTNTFTSDWNNPYTTRCRGGWFSARMIAGVGQYMSMEHVTLTTQDAGRQR
jgi:hypothetical protein